MAEISRKRVGELVRGVFHILLPHPDGLPAKLILERLPAVIPPTEFEQSTYPKHPDIRRYEKVVRFSTIAAVKAGWLTKNKGLWSLTDEGRQAFTRFPDPNAFALEANRLYRQWRRQQPPDDDEEEYADESTKAATTLEEAEESAWAEVEEHLGTINPYDFQDMVEGLLRGMGYHVVWVAPPGPDRGVDIIAQSDPLGVGSPRIKVQVKRSGDRMSVRDIRSFLAVLAEGDVGLFVASGGFTKDAEDEARNQEKRRVMLLDLRRLFDLWVEHYEQIPEANRRLLPLRPVYFLAPPQ
jgi:restriction system protein